eukprot:TRINITY_DN46959_c0_g1_i1.p1 TRINITY_DN46959_c0_g1~~TRINITY_DN46959_c0_g1_i1.p1  ORF type:complete len:617 (+),score=222.17 TRINITY_DN46959_c0_g1_i1:89-1852(+)
MPQPASLEQGRGIADDASEEDAAAWVKRMRKRKGKAALAAAAERNFAELDAAATAPQEEHTAAGLHVLHGAGAFEKGTEAVLTLKDQSIFDDTGKELADRGDVLESAELLAKERREFQKKARAGHYDKYDEAPQGILPQYDESNRNFEKGRRDFRLGQGGEMDAASAELQDPDAVAVAAAGAGKIRYDLSDFSLQRQRDTLTAAEEAALPDFRKPKRRKLVRRRDRAETGELVRSAAAELQQKAESEEEGTQRRTEAEQAEALRRLAEREEGGARGREMRDAAQKEIHNISQKTLTQLKEAPVGAADGWQLRDEVPGRRKRGRPQAEVLVIDPTAEFARTLEPEEPPSERTGKRKQGGDDRQGDASVGDRRRDWEPAPQGDEEPAPEELRRREADQRFRESLQKQELIAEPKVASSVADSLRFLRTKGLFDTARLGRSNDRVLEFNETNDPAPNIVFHRKDERGRELTQKEAFRQQSHIFHGKPPSKTKRQKAERRWSGLRHEQLMRDGDTALGGTAGLRHAQRATGQAGIVLQGGLIERAIQSARDGLDTPAHSAAASAGTASVAGTRSGIGSVPSAMPSTVAQRR